MDWNQSAARAAWIEQSKKEIESLKKENLELRKTITAFRNACEKLNNGTCWCGAGIDDPNYRGCHSDACVEMQALVSCSANFGTIGE